jgi:hypothetical protein
MDMSSVVVIAPERLSARMGEESVVLDLADGVYYGLDAVAARVWDLAKKPIAVAEIRDAIVSEFEVDAATCEKDLATFLSELAKKGMIEVTDGRGG